MKKIIEQAENLQEAIRYHEKKIDNPVLTLSMICKLDDFIYYLREEQEENV